MTIADPYKELKSLINSTSKNELECKRYLDFAKELLVKNTPIEFLDVESEYIGHTGISDYIISCRSKDDAGIEENYVYIWELKAPQCFLFEKDSNNRVIPTKDFISAENQLLHYYNENRESQDFKTNFNISKSDNVKLGGIIIGSNQTKVKGGFLDGHKNKLFIKALNIRKEILYGHNGIRVFIWDTILEHLKK